MNLSLRTDLGMSPLSGTTSTPGDAVLLETGDYVLTEGGDKILKE